MTELSKKMMYFLLLILFAYSIIILISQLMVNDQMFHPPGHTQDPPHTLKLKTANGKHITALYLPNPKAQYTLLYSHGNGEDLSMIYTSLIALRQVGFSVLAYDYQGYGSSEGSPSEKATYQDIEAAYDYLIRSLHIPSENIILYGFSIGSGPSIDLAARKPIGGLILQSPFLSIFRLLTKWPLLPWDPFNNLLKISRITCPILLIYGGKDTMIPSWHSKKLLDRIRAPVQTLFVENADHNRLILIAGPKYWKALQRFVSSLSKKP